MQGNGAWVWAAVAGRGVVRCWCPDDAETFDAAREYRSARLEDDMAEFRRMETEGSLGGIFDDGSPPSRRPAPTAAEGFLARFGLGKGVGR